MQAGKVVYNSFNGTKTEKVFLLNRIVIRIRILNQVVISIRIVIRIVRSNQMTHFTSLID